jgi:hypothetical protein
MLAIGPIKATAKSCADGPGRISDFYEPPSFGVAAGAAIDGFMKRLFDLRILQGNAGHQDPAIGTSDLADDLADRICADGICEIAYEALHNNHCAATFC